MRKLNLVPVAVKVHFSVPEGRGPIDWPTVLRSFAGAMAAQVAQIPMCVIGHIKGMVRVQDQLLHVHCVSAAVPVEVAGKLPEGLREITLELVLLVYGLTEQTAAEVLGKVGGRIGREYECAVTHQLTQAEGSAGHPASAR